jgi:hypothetical protein
MPNGERWIIIKTRHDLHEPWQFREAVLPANVAESREFIFWWLIQLPTLVLDDDKLADVTYYERVT